MNLRALARKDLNLLVTLAVLLQERNVTRAAELLFLTQPAISKALGRLREQFDDELFTRSSHGLVPTPLALSLQAPLASLLQDLSGLFVPEHFDPAVYHGKFSISVNEFIDLTLMPVLAAAISSEAPGVVLESLSKIDHQLDALQRGELDAVINLRFADMGDDIDAELLFSDGPGIFARGGHPLHRLKRVGRDELQRYPRVALELPDMERYALFSRTSGQRGLARSWPVACVTNNMISALAVVARTDYLFPGPFILSGFASEHLDFRALPTDAASGIRIEYHLMMHQRVRHSAAHRWLRRKIMDVARDFLPAGESAESGGVKRGAGRKAKRPASAAAKAGAKRRGSRARSA